MTDSQDAPAPQTAPESETQAVTVTTNTDSIVPEIVHESGFVHYGFNENGVFHPVASERQGDYNERVEAARGDNP